MPETIRNFGRNLEFVPARQFVPRSEPELLEIMRRHAGEQIRVVGSKHSWSPLTLTESVSIDLRLFCNISVRWHGGNAWVTVGGGCRIKHLLAELNRHGLTLPSLGLITEQTIAGATATGTHGSGKHSLSHYITNVRLACCDRTDQQPRLVEIDSGDELRAARCSLGCMGVVTQVTLPCIPQYFVEEWVQSCKTVELALAMEHETPLQQFFLLPYAWKYFVQRRRIAQRNCRSTTASIYRLYWYASLDIGMHVAIKLFASMLRSRMLIHGLYRWIVPALSKLSWRVADRSDRQLVMEHELFRHLELELFVQRKHISNAAHLIAEILKLADDPSHNLSRRAVGWLAEASALETCQSLRGSYSHHYPICFRRVVQDDTLISMASDCPDDCYAVSLITYTLPRDRFYRLVTLIAEVCARLFDARIHWGKWFPLDGKEVARQYPHLSKFREICRRFDPQGVFRNRFICERLGFESDVESPAGGEGGCH